MTSRRANVSLRLLEAGRGVLLQDGGATEPRPLRSFKLQANHVGSVAKFPTNQNRPKHYLPTPSEFHAKLCDLIRGAKHRVYLTSLYVGPGVSSDHVKERELLECLSAIPSHVTVKVLLDKNRALRPVPLADQSSYTTTSAEAVHKSLSERSAISSNQSQLRLFPVLPKFLPNPYDEIAGVFHVKLYIIDDDLIISGANLSEEYFCNRQDRYFLVQEGGAGLVDCYADLIDALCDYAHPYQENTSYAKQMSKNQLMKKIASILTSNAETTSLDLADVAAFAIPTFQAPAGFYPKGKVPFLSDVEATRNLLAAALGDPSDHVVRVATAYLNPTKKFLNLLAEFSDTQLLTAGRVSHGFAPKKKAGNKGKDWIPSVFDRLSTAAARDTRAKLLYYERLGWTFHAKGLWLSTQESNLSSLIMDPESLIAAVCGSGNFGARSERLDMESNCLLILPEGSPLKASLAAEWNELCHFAQEQPSDAETGYALPLSVKVAFPFIRNLF
jgi:CDP-diacylglycerol--glycerol-3-phosphate 3-phosphatidyltransferase